MCRNFRSPLLALAVVLFAAAMPFDDTTDVDTDDALLKRASIGATDDALLNLFRNRTPKDADTDGVRALIRQLGDDSYEVREKASAALAALGGAAEGSLREALQSPDIEIVRRAEDCLKLIKRGASSAVISAAARSLGRRKPAGTTEVLLGYLPFTDDEAVAYDIRAVLVQVAVRDGKPEPSMLAALSDKVATRRGAAAEALCRAGLADHEEILKLLKDAEPTVRLHVAVGLITAKRKDAVPALIDAIGRVPADKNWMWEEILVRLAGDNAPVVYPVNGGQSGDKARKAWEAWWREHGEQIDLAKLNDSQPLNFSLILMLDAGRVLELDAQNNIRWEFAGLQFPLDVQYLPGNRVLTAEHRGQVVTERDLKGKIIWQHAFESPIVAQRLPNGNTFIANHDRVVEISRDGKEVFNYVPPNGEQISKAQKLRNGQIALVLTVQTSRFVQIDATGKELRSFPIRYHTSGGRIDVLPNGNVLVPEHRDNRVVEYSPDGAEVWTASVELPIAAARLPNGNTLVTSMSQRRAVELDRRGQQVWEYKAETRVTRAYRR